MKKRIALLIALQITLLFNSCSSDSGDAQVVITPQVPVVTNTTIKSYSKDYGTTGETITMIGENFSTKISEIKITLDGVAATILSATATEIAFTLPATEKLLPKLVVTIENRTVTNSVVNNYNGNIGVLPIPSTTTWFTIDNNLKSDDGIRSIQMISDKILYCNGDKTGGSVSRTLDGGITWKTWAMNGFNAGFHATINDEGWSHTGFGLSKIAVGGYAGIDTFANFGTGTVVETPYCVYVDADMKNGTIVSQKGKVFSTTNGVDFTKVYELADNSANLFQSTVIDNNHLWAIGYKSLKDVNGFTADRPFILFKNNTTDGWKEYPFINEAGGYFAREICFVDSSTGFLLINKYYSALLDVKLYKTTNGGDTWSPIYNGEKFTKFAFKDTNTGWAILDAKIYKTTNGGVTWDIDFTHDQPIKNIAYKNNVVWAISKDKIIKRYL
jgi:photosystem II stability/assembly factor-like uncharacterized protein